MTDGDARASGARVTHVITGLTTGGAEMMLLKLLSGLTDARGRSTVISLRDEGTIGARIRELGVPVEALSLSAAPWRAYRELCAHVRRGRPDVLHGWMYHGNLAAVVARRSVGRARCRVVWGVRNSLEGLEVSIATSAVIRISAMLSSRVDRITYNSRASAEQHERFGFDPRKRVVIPNGFDTMRFRPSAEHRAAVRHSLGIPGDAPVIGLVARWDPMKDHAGFLRAVAAMRAPVWVVLAGRGIDASNSALMLEAHRLGLGDRLRVLGERADVERVLATLDACCSASRGEAFPNVMGEAMACEVPCIATDVGDSAWLLGDETLIVPPRDPGALAAALDRVMALTIEERRMIGRTARLRIEHYFGLRAVVALYEELYRSLVDEHAADDRKS